MQFYTSRLKQAITSGSGNRPDAPTISPHGHNRMGLDVNFPVLVAGTSGTTGAGSLKDSIVYTSHGAKVGDFALIANATDGTKLVSITKIVDANTFIIGQPFSADTGAVAITFYSTGFLKVDSSGNLLTASAVSTTGPAKIEDVPHVSGDMGMFSLAVANDALATFAADGDYVPFAVDVKGRNYVTGQVAHDAAFAGNPVATGAVARSSDITAVANADLAQAICDLLGRQVVLPYAIPDNTIVGQISNVTTATNTSLIAAQGAGVRIYINSVTVANESATASTISITDGSGGSTLWAARFPASATVGPITVNFPTPLRLTANTAAFVNTSAAGAAYLSAVGFKAAN